VYGRDSCKVAFKSSVPSVPLGFYYRNPMLRESEQGHLTG
jgi:hypothetical protein